MYQVPIITAIVSKGLFYNIVSYTLYYVEADGKTNPDSQEIKKFPSERCRVEISRSPDQIFKSVKKMTKVNINVSKSQVHWLGRREGWSKQYL